MHPWSIVEHGLMSEFNIFYWLLVTVIVFWDETIVVPAPSHWLSRVWPSPYRRCAHLAYQIAPFVNCVAFKCHSSIFISWCFGSSFVIFTNFLKMAEPNKLLVSVKFTLCLHYTVLWGSLSLSKSKSNVCQNLTTSCHFSDVSSFQWQMPVLKCISTFHLISFHYLFLIWRYSDSAGSSIDEISSIFCLIWMR